MPMAIEEHEPRTLVTSREPERNLTKAGEIGSMGDQALKDALLIIVAALVLLFLLGFSLRGHNI